MQTHKQTGDLATEVERIADGFSGAIGYVLINVETGEEVSREPDRVFPSASTIKWPILTAFHEFVNSGGVAWEDVVIPSESGAAGGSGVLMHLSSAVRLSYRDVAWLMICVSDNVATNIIIDTIGLERINRVIQALISPDLELLRQAGTGSEEIGDSMGLATPRALARHVQLLEKDQLPGAAETLAVSRQQLYRSGLPRYLREPILGGVGAITATKSGMVSGVRNDVGLLEIGETKIVAAVMTERTQENGLDVSDEGVRVIGRIGRAAVRAWSDPAVAP